MPKIKMTIEFDSTDEFLKSRDWTEMKEDIEHGEFEKGLEETEGVSNVRIGIKMD